MRDHTSTQLIAKEGWKYLGFTFALFVLALIFDFFSWVFLVVFLFTAYIFRNPERLPAEDDELAVLAPIDGTISSISKVSWHDKKEYIRVEIQKSLMGVSLIRSPSAMNLKSCKRRHGLSLPINSPLRPRLGEMASIECQTKYSGLYLHVNSGLFNRNIELFKTVGPLKTAQRFGVLVEGSIELFLALDTRIKVALGDDVRAGESVLGYFAYKGNDVEYRK